MTLRQRAQKDPFVRHGLQRGTTLGDIATVALPPRPAPACSVLAAAARAHRRGYQFSTISATS